MNMKIKEILKEIEEHAPLPLQDGFDNAGVQVGDISQPAVGALLCVDVTEDVIDEAVELDCNLIISHHPLLFKPLKSLTGRNYIERCVMKAVEKGIVIYSAHTNLDNARYGVNYKIAQKIGLQNIRVLSPKKNALLKLVVYIPQTHVDVVRNALFNAGAGHIGNYDSCSFSSEGEGMFRAGVNTDPFCGEIGELHVEPEVRVEVILPVFKKNVVLRALLATHPYEEPAYDFIPLENTWDQAGSGVVGELLLPEEEESFLFRLKDIFHLKTLSHSPLRGKSIQEVAVCGGSGAFLIPDAMAFGADVFITGEAKYNDYYDVEKNILLAVIGHYESEECTKEIFFEIITKKFPNFAVHFSNVNSNPVNNL